LNSNDAVVGATTATPSFSIASPSPTVAATPTSSGQAQLTPDATDDEMTVVIVDDNNNVPVGAGEFIVGGKVKVECNWCKKIASWKSNHLQNHLKSCATRRARKGVATSPFSIEK
jgi:hypothetical protein